LGILVSPLVALTLLVGLVAVVCEWILFLDPKVERRSPLLPYLAAARPPLPANRARVRTWGIAAVLVALCLAAILLLLDIAAP
jgi:hypothetical protein